MKIRTQSSEQDATDRLILQNTVLGSPPLVPEVRVRLLRDDSPLWRAFGKGSNGESIPCPYWAFAWGGGQALARYVLDHPQVVKGRRVLDFGAGSGLASIAAVKAGAAMVTASDVDPTSIRAIAHNAVENNVVVETVCTDLIYSEDRSWDVILAGDLWYDSRLGRHGLRWLRMLSAAGVLVLAGDAGRAFSPSGCLEELATYSCRSVPEVEHPNVQTVSVFRVLPAR